MMVCLLNDLECLAGLCGQNCKDDYVFAGLAFCLVVKLEVAEVLRFTYDVKQSKTVGFAFERIQQLAEEFRKKSIEHLTKLEGGKSFLRDVYHN